MFRREFIENAAWLATIPLINSAIPKQQTRISVLKDMVQVMVGKFTCTIFHDFDFKYLAKDYFINAEAGELSQSLQKYNIAPDNIPSPFIATLIDTGDKKILIDTGVGYADKPVEFRGHSYQFKGRLLQLLQHNNVTNRDISDVVITHFHPDHIGGLVAEDGKPNFPNARIHIHQDEWDYWHSANATNQSPLFHFFIEQKVRPIYKSDVNVFTGDFVEISPGVTAIKVEGHTPGQIAVNIKSGSEQMLYISDAFLHPLHLEKPEWETNFDLDHKKARKSREKLASLAYKGNVLVNAFHFEFPGLGMIDKTNSGWIWKTNVMYT